MKYLFLSIALILANGAFSQSAGFYLFNETTGAPERPIAAGDTIDLAQLYESPELNIRYVLPTEANELVYSLVWQRETPYYYGEGQMGLVGSARSRYFYNAPASLSFLTDEENNATAGKFDSLFITGPLRTGKHTIKATGGSSPEQLNTVYDSLEFYLRWGRGYDRARYYLIDPITHDYILELVDGDTLDKFLGGISATVEVVPAGIGRLTPIRLTVEYDSLHYFPDTLSYLKAEPIVYSNVVGSDEPRFLLTGYASSGRYFVINEADPQDIGLTLYLRGNYYPYTPSGSDSLVYDTVIVAIDSVILRDSLVLSYDTMLVTLDSLVLRDSVVFVYDTLLVSSDSTVYDTVIVAIDSLVLDTLGIDTYTELILPVLIDRLEQMEEGAGSLKSLLLKIRDEGLRSKEIYPSEEGE